MLVQPNFSVNSSRKPRVLEIVMLGWMRVAEWIGLKLKDTTKTNRDQRISQEETPDHVECIQDAQPPRKTVAEKGSLVFFLHYHLHPLGSGYYFQLHAW